MERDRLYRTLVAVFGLDAVLTSEVAIPVGADYADVLVEQARSCQIMLVLIGPDWLTVDEYGYSPSYWSQMEIATALQAGNIVAAVLLGGATLLPQPEDLPTKIAQLGRLRCRRLSEGSFDRDAGELVNQLTNMLASSRHSRRS
jgi:hypothetical protein